MAKQAEEKPRPKAAGDKVTNISGVVHTWKARDPAKKDRRYIVITIPYGDFKEFTYIQPYVDKTGKGWQRNQSRAHTTKLRKEMEQDRYTPTAFYAGVLEHHLPELKFEHKGGRLEASIVVTPSRKLACTDGGGRDGGLTAMLAAAIGARDEKEVERIRNLPITVHIHLDPETLVEDFLNYQRGKPMDKDTEQSLRLRHGLMDNDALPAYKMASQVAHKADASPRSHLFNQIAFASEDKASLSFSAVTMSSSSNQGCTLFGGSRLALHFGKKAEWAVEAYVEAYQAILASGPESEEEEEEEDGEGGPKRELPSVFGPGKFLTPNINKGSKGASAFLVGIGNMLLWKKGHLDQAESSPEDLAKVVQIVGDYYDRPKIGWSGEDKRRELGEFARHFFADIVAPDGLPPGPGQVEAVAGIPRDLLRILPPSNFKIPRELSRDLNPPKGKPAAKGPPPATRPELDFGADIGAEIGGGPRPKAPARKGDKSTAIVGRGIQA